MRLTEFTDPRGTCRPTLMRRGSSNKSTEGGLPAWKMMMHQPKNVQEPFTERSTETVGRTLNVEVDLIGSPITGRHGRIRQLVAWINR